MASEEIDDYLRGLDEPHRSALAELRALIASIVPEAEEGLSYAAPAFRIGGKAVAGFSAAKKHLSYLPHSGEVLGTMSAEELEGFAATKGALKIPLGSMPSEELVRSLISKRRAEAGV